MQRWIGRVALVTGASAGIGAGICRELAKQGLNVVGCARNAKRIEDLAEEDEIKSAPGKLYGVRCDLSKESDILSVFEFIRNKFGRIDVCINNAAFSGTCPLISGETDTWRNMMEVNVLALCICCREAYKLMMEKGINDGQIINISSIGGHKLPGPNIPNLNFYCATKFMVQALTDGLRNEVAEANTQIRVAVISPGVVKTEFFARAFDTELSDNFYAAEPFINPKDIADAVVYILKSPPYVDVNDIIIQPTGKPI